MSFKKGVTKLITSVYTIVNIIANMLRHTGVTIKKLFMKKNSTNYAIKMLGLTLIAFVALVKPAFCQTNWLDYALENWVVSVSPDQQVKFTFPKDIRNGDMITGSVIEEKKKIQEKLTKLLQLLKEL